MSLIGKVYMSAGDGSAGLTTSKTHLMSLHLIRTLMDATEIQATGSNQRQ
jgi:hypothetical protein